MRRLITAHHAVSGALQPGMKKSASVPVLGGVTTSAEREAIGRPTRPRIQGGDVGSRSGGRQDRGSGKEPECPLELLPPRQARRESPLPERKLDDELRSDSDVFKCDEPPASPAAEGLDSPNGFTSAGPPQGSMVLGPRVTAPGVQDDSPPSSAKSLRFSDQCIVRTYSLESLERSLSFADVALLDTAKDLAMKKQDGPSEAARLVDFLVRMLFNNKPRTVRELRGLLGPERCAEVTNAADAVAERFANLQERLLDIPEGGCIAMLPSNSKLQKQHVPWIEQLAQWATQLAPPPQRVHSKRRGGPSACCGARTAAE